MDPDACVDQLVGIAQSMLADPDHASEHDVERLAELVCALDGWLRRGGAWPQRWTEDSLRVFRGADETFLRSVVDATALTRLEEAVQESARRELRLRAGQPQGQPDDPAQAERAT